MAFQRVSRSTRALAPEVAAQIVSLKLSQWLRLPMEEIRGASLFWSVSSVPPPADAPQQSAQPPRRGVGCAREEGAHDHVVLLVQQRARRIQQLAARSQQGPHAAEQSQLEHILPRESRDTRTLSTLLMLRYLTSRHPDKMHCIAETFLDRTAILAAVPTAGDGNRRGGGRDSGRGGGAGGGSGTWAAGMDGGSQGRHFSAESPDFVLTQKMTAMKPDRRIFDLSLQYARW